MDDADDTVNSRREHGVENDPMSATESGEKPQSDADASRSETEEADASTRNGSVAGTLARDQPLEPEAIELENAIFVLLGVLLVVGLIAAGVVGF